MYRILLENRMGILFTLKVERKQRLDERVISSQVLQSGILK